MCYTFEVIAQNHPFFFFKQFNAGHMQGNLFAKQSRRLENHRANGATKTGMTNGIS